MTYYRVPAILDQRKCYKPARAGNGARIPNGWILIGGELLTEAECKRRNAPLRLLEPVQIKKTQTYFFFGARFPFKEV